MQTSDSKSPNGHASQKKGAKGETPKYHVKKGPPSMWGFVLLCDPVGRKDGTKGTEKTPTPGENGKPRENSLPSSDLGGLAVIEVLAAGET